MQQNVEALVLLKPSLSPLGMPLALFVCTEHKSVK